MTEYVCDIKQDYQGIPYEHDDFSGTMERLEEIVRCRDCKYAWREGTICHVFGCGDIPAMVEPDGFCAWGRKMEQPRFLTSHLTK